MTDIAVDLATDQEARACLALMPEVWRIPCELLIARRGGDLAGAAALCWRAWRRPPGFPLHIHVIPGERRRGVGRALLAKAADLASTETDGLWSLTAVPDADEAGGFLRACGFAPASTQHDFQARIEDLLARIEPLAERARRRETLGKQFVVAPLSAADPQTVGWLVSAELGGRPFALARSLDDEGPEGQRLLAHSQAILHDGDLAGVMVWGPKDGVATVEARVVAPRFRGGPANLLLLQASLRRARDEGLAEFRFQSDAANQDTLALARRSGATEVARRSFWRYAIAAV
jgi:GNAT superfamily N-acetyltransferase